MTLYNEKYEQECGNEEQCLKHIIKLKYREGYICKRCKNSERYWVVEKKRTFECSMCNHQESVLSGTIFQDSHIPLSLWFRAIWYIISQENRVKALGLQKKLGIKCYKTALSLLHKVHLIMLNQRKDLLHNTIEVALFYENISRNGPKSINCKVLIAIVMEIIDEKPTRIRIGHIADNSPDSFRDFIQKSVAEESSITMIFNTKEEYNRFTNINATFGSRISTIDKKRYDIITEVKERSKQITVLCSSKYLQYYLDECSFHFNQRHTDKWTLFNALLKNAVQQEPVTYHDIKADKINSLQLN